MNEELERLLEAEREAVRKAEEAINGLNGPQPVSEGKMRAAEQFLAERVAAHEAVSKYRAEHSHGLLL